MIDTEIGMNFDKNDVVIVAMAKIESEIRRNIRESKNEISRIDKKIIDIDNEYRKNGKDNPPKVVVDKEKFYNDVIKKSKDSLGVITVHSVANNKDSLNSYSVMLQELDQDGKVLRSIYILQKNTSLTARQKAILKEMDNLLKERETQVSRGVDWKKKLNDIPAAERQMKAVVVESELNKSKEGKALVDLLTKNYLGKIKEIEM